MTYEIPERLLSSAARGGWVGIDMDGTLFKFPEDGNWLAWNIFGEPIAPMVHRAQVWYAAGIDLRIVTARIALPLQVRVGSLPSYSTLMRHECKISKQWYSDDMMASAIKKHCDKHLGFQMPVQCYKDYNMIELWDDRAVQVVANTGRTLAEEHEAELAALRGKSYRSDRSGDAYVLPASATHGPL